MSEDAMHAVGLLVESVEPASPAERAGVRVGDVVVALNGRPVADVLDFRFRVAVGRPYLRVLRQGTEVDLRLPGAAEGGVGLTFANELGDRVHTCNNRCVFCFIHQMPKRMRKSLYLMDDDFRLSFMHGNYVTLTNVSDEEWRRILEQRLSPLYVSVHATDPVLRGRMLGRRAAAPILPQIRELARHGIDVHAQVVLCPGWNDGEALNRTVHELADEHPARTGLRWGVRSVAIVPVGLTKYRERLTPLDAVDRTYAEKMIQATTAAALRLKRVLGSRFVWLSDEWYWLAGKPTPGRRHYEEFPQLEDGVGTTRLFLDEAARLARRLPAAAPRPVDGTAVTAPLASGAVRAWLERLNTVQGVSLDLCIVPNRFFGERINVAGLMTAQDIAASLQEHGGVGTVFVPAICLRDSELFLDDARVEDLERACSRPVRIVEPRPRGLAAALGLMEMPGTPRGVPHR